MSGKKRGERRQSDQDELIPASGERLSPELETQLMEKTGFTRAELYNRRGAITEKGLTGMLVPGDKILETHEDHAVIERPGGIIQTIWNLRKFPAWAKPVEPTKE